MKKALVGIMLIAFVLVFATGAMAGQFGIEAQGGGSSGAITDLSLGLRLNRIILPGFTYDFSDKSINPRLGLELNFLRVIYHWKAEGWSVGLHLGPFVVDYITPTEMIYAGLAFDFGERKPRAFKTLMPKLVEEAADWLMTTVRPSGVYDFNKGGAIGIETIIWDGDVLDGVLGEIPQTNRYYAGIEYPLKNLNVLGNKVDNLAIGAGFAGDPDLTDIGGIFWASYVLR